MERLCRGALRWWPFLAIAACVPAARVSFGGENPPLSDDVFVVDVTNASGSGQLTVPVDQGYWDPNAATFDWVLPAPVNIMDPARRAIIARVLNADVHVKVKSADEFEIEMSVGVFGGGSETAFSISSAQVMFDTIPHELAVGRAFATFTVTDIGADGACLVAEGPPGMGAYRCYYNGYLGAGSLFTHLISVVCVDSGGTADATQLDPLSGFRPFGADVHDVSTQLAFTLSPGDLAFATTFTDGPAAPLCIGDLDGDWVVTLADLAGVLSVYGSAVGDPGFDPTSDLDGNGVIGLNDLTLLLDQYGTDCLAQ